MASDIPRGLVFRTDAERGMPPVLREVMESLEWTEYDETKPDKDQPRYQLWWRTNRFTASQINSAKYPYQRINHYPKSSEITRKDSMVRHLRRMRVVYGSAYDYLPNSFVLPNEYVKFCQHYAEEKNRADKAKDPAPAYICKPSDLSRGRKIFVFNDIGELTYDCSSVVQTYVARPLLINGHKVDFRIYVLVTSFQPLRCYIYRDGLVRFSVERYDLADLQNIFCHLTNYSINKNSTTFEEFKDGIGFGCKWDIQKELTDYFAKLGIDMNLIWQRIDHLVRLTLLSICSVVGHVAQCFELYGFDILLDDDFKPWLVEVNFSPALATDADVDCRVKEPLMRDMLGALNIIPFAGDDKEHQAEAESKAAATACPSPPKDEGEEGASSKPSTPSALPPINQKKGSSAAAPKSAPGVKKTTANAKPPTTTTTTSATRRASDPRTTTTIGAQKRSASSNTTASRLARQPAHKETAASAMQQKATPTHLIDRPFGKFVPCFPYSPETEEMSLQLAKQATSPDSCLRAIVSELKKADAKVAAQMKEYPAKAGKKPPRQQQEQQQPTEEASAVATPVPPTTAPAAKASPSVPQPSKEREMDQLEEEYAHQCGIDEAEFEADLAALKALENVE